MTRTQNRTEGQKKSTEGEEKKEKKRGSIADRSTHP
jgi:hypothetical protein